MIDLVVLGDHIRHGKGFRIARAHQRAAFFCEVRIMPLFIDGKIELLFFGVERFLCLILVQFHLSRFEAQTVGGIHLGLKQARVFRLAGLNTVQQHANLMIQFLVLTILAGLRRELFGFRQKLVAQPFLLPPQFLNLGLQLSIHALIFFHDRWATDDQGGPGFIDKNGVHLIDDRKVMTALHLFLRTLRHAVVAQVIKAKLGVRAVGDVAIILLTPHGGMLLVLDATNGEAEKTVHLPHPFTITRS